MAPVVEKITDPLPLGEGPHWDSATQTLFFVDIDGHKLHRYVPATKKHSILDLGGTCSFVIPVEGKSNTYLSTVGKRVVLISWDGNSSQPDVVENLFEVQKEAGKEAHRINDGKTDPSGRVWAGTMGPLASQEKDYVFDSIAFCIGDDKKPITRITEVGLSNGLAWSSDCKTMYYIDSLKKSVDAFDYNLSTGDIANRRVVFDVKKHGIEGFPDGMTIDTEDKLWVAVFGAGKVLRIDPASGSLLSSLEIPAPNVTSVAFGGQNLDELYVTSANFMITKELREKYPDAGCVFRVTGLNVKGHPGTAARL